MDEVLTALPGRRRRGRWAVMVVLVALLLASRSSSPAAELTQAEITRIIQEVQLLSARTAPRPAVLKDTVTGDTAVRTGTDSRTELTFPDQTLARLGANTTFTFNKATRDIDLGVGVMLLYAPKNSGGATISTAAVTAAITGTTVLIEAHSGKPAADHSSAQLEESAPVQFGLVSAKAKAAGWFKFVSLEGVARVFLNSNPADSVQIHPGEMLIVPPGATRLPKPVTVDLEKLVASCLLITDFAPLQSLPLIAEEIRNQEDAFIAEGGPSLVTDPTSNEVLDQAFSAFPLGGVPGPIATTITFAGLVAGNWSSPASWTPMFVPNNGGGNTYTAIINSGMLTQDIAPGVTIQQLQMTGGTLVLTNPLTLNTGLQFTGGTFVGGNLFIAGASTQSVSMTVQNVMLSNTGAYDITLASGFAFSASGSNFINSGTLRKADAGMEEVMFNIPINNSGTISISNGAFTFTAGGTNTGIFSAAAGSVIQLASNFSMLSGTRFSGPGIVSFANGTVTTLAGTITNTGTLFINSTGNFTDLALNGNVTLTGGGVLNLTNADRILGNGILTTNNTIQGDTNGGGSLGADQIGIVNQAGGVIDANASGLTLDVDPNAANGLVNQGTMRASNGGILLLNGNGGGGFNNVGTIETINGGALQFSGAVTSSGLIDVSAGSLTILGTGSFSQTAGTFQINDGGVENDGTFFAQSNTSIVRGPGGGVFNNVGTFTRNVGTGTFTIDIGFNNTGTVNANSGILTFSGGDAGGTTGDFTVAAGAQLNFTSNFTFAASSDLSGAGTVNFNGGTQTINGTLTVPAVGLRGSIVNLNIPASLTALTGTAGTINIGAAGSLMVANGIDFSGSNFSTPGANGGNLIINAPSFTSNPGTINGANFNGADAVTPGGTAGGGGTLTVNTTTGNIVVGGSSLSATTGIIGTNDPPSGAGGTVNLTSNSGTVAIINGGTVQVSSGDAVGTPDRRSSASGGNITMQSGAATGTSVSVTNTAQVLSLLENTAPGPGGLIVIRATSLAGNSLISTSGPIRADRGGIDIRNSNDAGQISLGNLMMADVIKVATLGDNSTLNINGGSISAVTLLRLYAGSISPANNSTINFNGSVNLSGAQIDIAAHQVNILGAATLVNTSSQAHVYADMTNFQGSFSIPPDIMPLGMAPPLGAPGVGTVAPRAALSNTHLVPRKLESPPRPIGIGH